MKNVNKVILVGRMGKDPELRYTPKQVAVANFSMATTQKISKDQEKTEWHNIVAWDKSAEFCDKYLKKGRLIWVEGRLETRKWEDKNGAVRYTTEVIATDIGPLDSGKAEGEGGGEGLPPAFGSDRAAKAAVGSFGAGGADLADDDIPF